MKYLVILLLLLGCGRKPLDGVPGEKGDPGSAGQDGVGKSGADGKDGAAGTSCTVNNMPDGSIIVSCTDGTSATIPARHPPKKPKKGKHK